MQETEACYREQLQQQQRAMELQKQQMEKLSATEEVVQELLEVREQIDCYVYQEQLHSEEMNKLMEELQRLRERDESAEARIHAAQMHYHRSLADVQGALELQTSKVHVCTVMKTSSISLTA